MIKIEILPIKNFQDARARWILPKEPAPGEGEKYAGGISWGLGLPGLPPPPPFIVGNSKEKTQKCATLNKYTENQRLKRLVHLPIALLKCASQLISHWERRESFFEKFCWKDASPIHQQNS